MSIFSTNKNQVQVFRGNVMAAIFVDEKGTGTTILDLFKAITEKMIDDGADLDENHPLVRLVDYCEGNTDLPVNDAVRAISGLNLHNLIGFSLNPDPDLVKQMSARMGAIMADGDLWSKEDLSEKVFDSLGNSGNGKNPGEKRNNWFEINFAEAIAEVYKDDRVCRYNGEREKMESGRGRWSFLGMPEYQSE